ncbi:related to endo-1,6-beta-d-glucanase precursor [Pseudozyma flocculosa]|uniref:Related to endo-1,6-beta-d-glucanase n=1 Tax=Pseudozyma flocculosa TaxID=84751 RepID=A0A5C3F977_9BASI|nr:related to endo-1,6-beta-d-glucanase precursor [Pseudozyma flocculosa]
MSFNNGGGYTVAGSASQSAFSADEPYSNHGYHSGEKRLPTAPRSAPLDRVRGWSTKKKLVVFGLAALALLALIIGLAVGLTVGNSSGSGSADDGSFVPSSPDGSQPLDGSRASLLRAGTFYTANDNSSSFVWSPAPSSSSSGSTSSPTLGNLGGYRSDSQGVDVVLNSSVTYQPIDGFGSALTDSAAYLLTQLKSDQPGLYGRTMDYLFNNATGMQIVRVTMASSDFSVGSEYTYIPASKAPSFDKAATQLDDLDAMLAGFSIEGTQTTKYVLPVLQDALKRSPDLKVMLSPWSPPAFMKTKNQLDGGTLRDGFEAAAAEYYLRTAKAFAAKGVVPYAMTLQNEPSFPTDYPSMTINATVQSRMASELKNRLAAQPPPLRSVKVLGHDDNWSGWDRAADLVSLNSTALDGVAFHCYKGSPSEVSNFTTALSSKSSSGGGGGGVAKPEVHMTECTGTETPTSRWSAMQGWLGRVHLPMLAQDSRSIIMWNLALDAKNGPYLAAGYCSNCVGALTVDMTNRTSALTVGAQSYLVTQFAAASRDLSATLTKPATTTTTTTATAMTRRIGLVVENTCTRDVDLVVSSDGRRLNLTARPGLETFVWTAP